MGTEGGAHLIVGAWGAVRGFGWCLWGVGKWVGWAVGVRGGCARRDGGVQGYCFLLLARLSHALLRFGTGCGLRRPLRVVAGPKGWKAASKVSCWHSAGAYKALFARKHDLLHFRDAIGMCKQRCNEGVRGGEVASSADRSGKEAALARLSKPGITSAASWPPKWGPTRRKRLRKAGSSRSIPNPGNEPRKKMAKGPSTTLFL
jgi:hypothetical protein